MKTSFILIAFLSLKATAQTTTHIIRWAAGDPCCKSMMNNGALEKLISLNGDSLAVGVTLGEASGMLNAWIAIVSQSATFNVDPATVHLRILVPIEKEIFPIEEWKLNMLRI